MNPRGNSLKWGLPRVVLCRALLSLLLALSALAAFAVASDGVIIVTTYPSRAVADGKSNITVNAEVRDSVGRLVPDGTQVAFQSKLGDFRESILTTQNGLARGILVAGSIAGITQITVSAPAYNATTTIDFEFVATRSQLSSAAEYIEVYSPRYLVYSPDLKLIAAAAPNHGVVVKYRDITIEADDVQVNARTYELKAKRATISTGKQTLVADDLFMKLNSRYGFAVGKFALEKQKPTIVFPFLRMTTTVEEVYGVAELVNLQPQAAKQPPLPKQFEFVDLTNALSLVSARRIIAYPQRELLFQKATVFIQASKIMSIPLYRLAISSDMPVFSDQMFAVTNSQLAVDYPYYLDLKPGHSSNVRLKLGNRYGGRTGASGGAFVDYELRWDQGDKADGGLTVGSIGRKDWGIQVRHYVRTDDSTAANLSLDFPAHSSVLGAANVSKQLKGWQANLSTNWGSSVKGPKYTSQQNYLALERDPIPIKKTPFRLYNGITANTSSLRATGFSSSQQAIGFRSRLQSQQIKLNSNSNMFASFSASKQFGKNVNTLVTLTGNLAAYTQINRHLGGSLTYRYSDDRSSSAFLGRHQLTAESSYDRGKAYLRLYAVRGLDVNRLSTQADASYRFSSLWRVGGQYSFDQILGSRYTDTSLIVGYTLGMREVGLSWSSRTKRIGIEILGTVNR